MEFIMSLLQSLTSFQQSQLLNLMMQSLTRAQIASLTQQPTIESLPQYFTEQELQYGIDVLTAASSYQFGNETVDDYEW
jgi:hypothetical protein